MLSSVNMIGMVHWYDKSAGQIYSYCPLFELVPSSISTWVDYVLTVQYRVCYRKWHDALRVQWPCKEKIGAPAQLLERDRPNRNVIRGFFAAMDGGRLPCADYTEGDVQNAYYKGYTISVEVTNFLVYDFHGAIIHAGFNLPCSWHDARLANWSGLTYQKLSDDMTLPGFAILCDTTFKVDVKGTMRLVVRARETNKTVNIPESFEL